MPALLERFADAIGERPVELIVVNNGSTDDTADVLAGLLSKRPYGFARCVSVERNVGYGHGLMTGLREARADVVAITHADLQCDPADVIRAYERLHSEPDTAQVLVKGRRYGRPRRDRLITIGMQIAATLALRMVLTDINAQPKLFHRRLLNELIAPPADFNFDVYLMYAAKKLGMRILTIPVVFGPRHHGASNWAYSLRSKLRHIGAGLIYLARLGVLGDTAWTQRRPHVL